MEKYIFLDIDGVLNTRKSMVLDRLEDNHSPFDPNCMRVLNDICNKTGARIVISSSWRPNKGSDAENLKWLRDVFSVRDFMFPERIIGQTIRAYHYLNSKGVHLSIPRGVEIKQWLDTHVIYPWHAYPDRDDEFRILNPDGSFKMMRSQKEGVDYQYAIIDDDTDMLLEHVNNFFMTDNEDGLTTEIGERIIKLLNK